MTQLFFKTLERRAAYKVKADGTFFPYETYRDAIAEDCQYRCVYCDNHEDVVGGREAMQLDHFRPWRKKFAPNNETKFAHLKNEPANLVHSCGVCNRFKWAHWPTETPEICYDHEKGWIDPFVECRTDFFEVLASGKIAGKKPPAIYQITKLRLNRPLLQKQRELRLILEKIKVRESKWKTIIANEPGTAHAQTAADALGLLQLIMNFIK